MGNGLSVLALLTEPVLVVAATGTETEGTTTEAEPEQQNEGSDD